MSTPHLLDRHERPLREHLVEDRKKLVDVSLVVHDLDEDGEIGRQVDDALSVDDAGSSKPGEAVNDRRTCEALLAQSFEQRAVERLMMPLVRVADEDANQTLLAVENVMVCLLMGRKPPATTKPNKPARENQNRCAEN